MSRAEVISKRCIRVITLLVFLNLGTPAFPEDDYLEMSLEDLMDVEIVSVSKKVEKLSEAAAAVYVITSEDIRRSGVTSIAEALRMAPGLQVARIDANKWAITSRGFNGGFANKLLVLIDGRSVYTPLFSGVYWDVQDVLLEDIDRIEIVRGPGGTLWGANAVNGVINIITKSSANTQGTFLKLGAGTEERGLGAFRHGGKVGDGVTYRAYGKFVSRDNSLFEGGDDANDQWDVFRGGVRFDWELSDRNTFTLMSDLYSGDAHQTFNWGMLSEPWYRMVEDKTSISGMNALGRWTHSFNSFSEMTLQTYFDRTRRFDGFAKEVRNTFDLDIQHHQKLSSQVSLLMGAGYRLTQDDVDRTSQSWAIPLARTDDLYNAFVQTTISLIENKLRLTVGSKFEHNDYTGFEYQPGTRLLWLPQKRHSVWVAVARAVRTPSRIEHDARIISCVLPPLSQDNPSPFPVLLVLTGKRQFESEELLAYEAGYRIQMSDGVSLDLAGFYNVYDKLRNLEAGDPIPNSFPPTYITVPVTAGNNVSGKTYGLELAADWRAMDCLAFKASYTHIQIEIDGIEVNLVTRFGNSEGGQPRNQIYLRMIADLTADIELDAGLRYVDALPVADIDSYTALDIRMGWKLHKNLELALGGQNLLEPRHIEYLSERNRMEAENERGVYATMAWGF